MKSNIVFIICDQLRKDCIASLGDRPVLTPNIDKLIDESVICDENFVANPICMPNRRSIFSGTCPRNHGVWTNGILVKDQGATLMYQLKENGYQTANIGKIHFEPGGFSKDSGSMESDELWKDPDFAGSFTGPYYGFDYIQITNGHHEPGGHMIKWFKERGGTADMLKIQSICGQNDTGVISSPKELHSSAFVADRAIDYIDNVRDQEKPFFLTVSFPDPHHPYSAPKECYDKVCDRLGDSIVFDDSGVDTRPTHYQEQYNNQWHRNKALFKENANPTDKLTAKERVLHTYAMVELIDENCGKIINALKERGLYDDTIFVFTSDHGELLGTRGLWYKGPFFYDCLIKTPLAIRVPNCEPKRCDGLVSAIDLAPTLCDLVGVEIPFYIDGVSQKEMLYGNTKAVRDSCSVEYRTGYGAKNDTNSKVLITPEWKFVMYQDGEKELTNRLTDPKEDYNLANNAEYKEVITELEHKLLLNMLQTESKFPQQHSHA